MIELWVASCPAEFSILATLEAARQQSTVGLLSALDIVDQVSPDAATRAVRDTANHRLAARLLEGSPFLNGVGEALQDEVREWTPLDMFGVMAHARLQDTRRLGGRVALTVVANTLREHSTFGASEVRDDMLAAMPEDKAPPKDAPDGERRRTVADYINGKLRAYAQTLPDRADAARARLAEYSHEDGEEVASVGSAWSTDDEDLKLLGGTELADRLPLTDWAPSLQDALGTAPGRVELTPAQNYQAGIHHALAALALVFDRAGVVI